MSASTVRRKIKAGTIPASQVPTTQGHEWRVFPEGGLAATGDYVGTAGAYLPPNGEHLATGDDQGVTSLTAVVIKVDLPARSRSGGTSWRSPAG